MTFQYARRRGYVHPDESNPFALKFRKYRGKIIPPKYYIGKQFRLKHRLGTWTLLAESGSNCLVRRGASILFVGKRSLIDDV